MHKNPDISKIFSFQYTVALQIPRTFLQLISLRIFPTKCFRPSSSLLPFVFIHRNRIFALLDRFLKGKMWKQRELHKACLSSRNRFQVFFLQIRPRLIPDFLSIPTHSFSLFLITSLSIFYFPRSDSQTCRFNDSQTKPDNYGEYLRARSWYLGFAFTWEIRKQQDRVIVLSILQPRFRGC